MRKGLTVLGIVLTAILAAPVIAAAANSPAQIVNCAGTPPWCFSPNPIRITAGSSVTWTNNTGPTHTATSDTGAWDTGNIATGQTSRPITFNSAGTFTYHCAIHPSMTGSIIVSAVATATATAAPTARSTTTSTVHTLARSGGGSPVLPLGAGVVVVGLALLGLGALSRRRRQI